VPVEVGLDGSSTLLINVFVVVVVIRIGSTGVMGRTIRAPSESTTEARRSAEAERRRFDEAVSSTSSSWGMAKENLSVLPERGLPA